MAGRAGGIGWTEWCRVVRPIILLWDTSVVLHGRVLLLSRHWVAVLVVLVLRDLVVQGTLSTRSVLARVSFGSERVEDKLL